MFYRILLLAVVIISCSPDVPDTTPPSYYGCTGTDICAYDKHNEYLGVVINSKGIDGITFMEIQSLQGYTIYTDNEGNQLDYNYEKYNTNILTSFWPIKNEDILGVYFEQETPKTSLSITTIHNGDITLPKRYCYDGPLKSVDNIIFYKLAREMENPNYPGIIVYYNTNKIHKQELYIPLYPCDKSQSGFPSYITDPIEFRNSEGKVYKGTIDNKQCVIEEENCLLVKE